MNPPWIEECEEEQDDDWFFDSIKRYEQLCMYKLSCKVQSFCLSPDGTKIAVVGAVKSTDNSSPRCLNEDGDSLVEILVFQLPSKLLVTCPVKEGLLSKTDFFFKAGIRFKGDPTQKRQIRFTCNDRLVEICGSKMQLWAFSDASDLMAKSASLDVNGNLAGIEVANGNVIFIHSTKNIMKVISFENGDFKVGSTWEFQKDIDKLEVAGNKVHVFSDAYQKLSIIDIDQNDENTVKEESFKTNSIKSVATGLNKKLSLVHVQTTDGKVILTNQDGSEIASSRFISQLDHKRPENVRFHSEHQIVSVQCGCELLLFKVTKDKRMKFVFAHDAHKNYITDYKVHKNVANLVFSSDIEGSLHAWKYNELEN